MNDLVIIGPSQPPIANEIALPNPAPLAAQIRTVQETSSAPTSVPVAIRIVPIGTRKLVPIIDAAHANMNESGPDQYSLSAMKATICWEIDWSKEHQPALCQTLLIRFTADLLRYFGFVASTNERRKLSPLALVASTRDYRVIAHLVGVRLL